MLGEAQVSTRLAYVNRYTMTSISSTPEVAELQALIGASVSTGFRAAMTDVVPGEADAASLLHLLLDDLPAPRS